MTASPLPEYSNSPVIEAVIDVRVDYEMGAKDMRKLSGKLKKKYPNDKTIREYGIPGVFDANFIEQPPIHEQFMFSSHDQLDHVILAKSMMAVSRRAPYLGWELLHDQMAAVWKLWKSAAGTQPISRIATRHINRIDIPRKCGNPIKIEDFLSFKPEISPCEAEMLGFFMQVTRRTNNPAWYATITLAPVLPMPLIGYVSILLDIDVFRTDNIPVNDIDLLSVIAEAREIKNTVFQECITDTTRELYS